jgi:tripartite-type tricarboxylate transporter receptor subunit TctC
MLFAGAAVAQNAAAFPERPVRLVIQFAPGGAVDIAARTLAKELGELWGKPVVVENKAGASGLIGGDAVAKAAADGHTLLLATDGTTSLLPLTIEKMPYDPLTDLVPLGMVGAFPQVLVASSSLRIKSVAELVAAARARPGTIDYATNGMGSSQHLAWEQFGRHARVNLNHVPFKSAAPALQEVLSGRVGVMLTGFATAYPYIKDGRLVPLAIGGLERQPALPDLPTVTELGFPELDATVWMGVFAPRGTPPALLEKISADLNKVTRGKVYADSLATRGTEARTSTGRDLADRIRSEYERNRSLLKAIGFKPS